jgi:hypothetical protein
MIREMSRVYSKIREAVEADRVLIGWHADEQCEHRRVETWQIVAGMPDGELINERPRSKPNPSIVLRQTLADGTTVHVVWAWLSQSARAKLVTVFFQD